MKAYWDALLNAEVAICEPEDLKLQNSDSKPSGFPSRAAMFSDGQEPATFDEAVEARIEADSRDVLDVQKRAEAVRFCVGKYPDLYDEFLEANRQKSSEQREQPKKTKGQNAQPATFDEAVEARIKADSRDVSDVQKRAKAVRFCVGKYPDLHKKFLAKNK